MTIEWLAPPVAPRSCRVAVFDFDGTLSLIRAGWWDVMRLAVASALREAGAGPARAETEAAAFMAERIGPLAGTATIHQMAELAREVRRRGGPAREPEAYKREYLARLAERTAPRLAALREGRAAPEAFLVPGARAFLEALARRGLRLYLASGTDETAVREEASLLDLARYFDGGILGAREGPGAVSKAELVRRVVASGEARGDEIVGFGDGPVEIEAVKAAGGLAVGVATDEPGCLRVDPAKRARLARAGADLVVPNYLAGDALLRALLGPPPPYPAG